jgi:NADH:ubiquinone oxidoreductase subunit 2 (subunit N)
VGALLGATLPEAVLCAGIVAILLLEAFTRLPATAYPRICLGTVVAALVIVAWKFLGGRTEVAGPLVVDGMAGLFRLLFLASGAYALLFGMRQGEAWFRQAEFHVLLLGALAGG